MKLPDMVPVRLRFEVEAVENVEKETLFALDDSGVLESVCAGGRAAIGVGSRGIARQVDVIRTLCQAIRDKGAAPFIFPAMGSHGGATSEGQTAVLHSLGITKDTVNADIRSEAEGVWAGETKDGIPLYTDRFALEADHVILINRIKPHTKFKGHIESGIAKMLTVGMGKIQGAAALHRLAVPFGFPHVITTGAQALKDIINFRFGAAIVETPDKQVHSLSIIKPETMIAQEEVLLKRASEIMARIPFDQLDLLIIDRIGKDISGTGMDTNVIGRNRDILGSFTTSPNVHRIFVRDLTPATQGNANGIGYADFTTQRLVDKIDMKKTYKNALTAMSPEKAAVPVTLANDQEAIETALESVGLTDGADARVVRIKNTSELSQMQISQALLPDLKNIQTPKIDLYGKSAPMVFDVNGDLV
jgi:hypothetical protein